MSDYPMDAACVDTNLNQWVPEKELDKVPAHLAAICASCPVAAECLKAAVHFDDTGYRAGLTYEQRKPMRRKTTARIDHGHPRTPPAAIRVPRPSRISQVRVMVEQGWSPERIARHFHTSLKRTNQDIRSLTRPPRKAVRPASQPEQRKPRADIQASSDSERRVIQQRRTEQVRKLTAAGMTADEIALEIDVCRRTVDRIRKRINDEQRTPAPDTPTMGELFEQIRREVAS